MKITFLGGADEVGASSLLLEIGSRRLLVDAGIRPSPKAHWGLAGDQLPDLSLIDQAGGIDAILVTHAHTDHTGALELVAGRYPNAPIYATPPTIALTRVLHQDSRRIMQSRLEEEGELPLFDDVAVGKLMSAFVPVPFNTRLPLADDLVATFFPAGHIAGAAMIGLESQDGRLLISGDVSISPQRTVDGARPPAFQPDVLVLESTYGGRLHANRLVEERRLAETVAEVTSMGGKVLIPAFALGRAQELLLILGEFQGRGEIPVVPVWADGMVRAICQAYSGFPEALPLPFQERGASFFGEHIRPVQRPDQRNALIWQPEPAVIIASSGMLAGGPSQSYARALAGQPQHAILLTGYQDEEAPGRRLQEIATRGHGAIRLGKDKVDVQCRLGTYSLSAHADEGQLISLVETLDPAEVLLVHGDEAARDSLAKALQERGRGVTLPHAGGIYEFHYTLDRLPLFGSGLGGGKPLDLAILWERLAGQTGGYFTVGELARAWWGQSGDQHAAELDAALEKDKLYFVRDQHRQQVFRARTRPQVDLFLKRRAQMEGYGELVGQWLVLRSPEGSPQFARCLATEPDHMMVEIVSAGETSQEPVLAWPEQLLDILGTEPPQESILQKYQQPSETGLAAIMEPNRALAQANQQFPAESGLKRTGYRLDQHVLILTFDFPDVALERYAGQIELLQEATGWQVEVTPEANQAALSALARETLPEGWHISKGPAIHRDQRRVALTASPPAGFPSNQISDLEEIPKLAAARRQFLETSGYELEIRVVEPPARPAHSLQEEYQASGGEPWEINAAYSAIKATLAGSTLYRTSLKGDEIVLSFISPQVGERYKDEIQALSKQTGWKLNINPQSNQGAILEAARSLLARSGWTVQKGPGVYPDRAEVAVTLAALPEADEVEAIHAAFEEQTGYHLIVSSTQTAKQAPQTQDIHAVQIPLGRIRLRAYHQELTLDPEKLKKAVERARRLGQISPPIQVRRLTNGYLLMDGLYRLHAAQALGLDHIPALIE